MRGFKKFISVLLVLSLTLISVAGGAGATRAQAANLKTVTVSTEAELREAMADSKVGSIIFSTKAKGTLVIPDVKGGEGKKLTINAKNMSITNKASLKGVTVKAAKKFTEAGENNTIVVKASKANVVIAESAQKASISVKGAKSTVSVESGATVKRLSNMAEGTTMEVAEGASVSKLTSSGDNSKLVIAEGASTKNVITNGKDAEVTVSEGASVTSITTKGTEAAISIAEGAVVKDVVISGESANLNVQSGARLDTLTAAAKGSEIAITSDGQLSEVVVKESAGIALSGKSEEAIAIKVNDTAEGTSIVAQTQVSVEAKASVKVDLREGAEDSDVEIKSEAATVEFKNNTAGNVTVKDAEGGKTEVKQGEDLEVTGKPELPVPSATPTQVPEEPSIPTIIPVPTAAPTAVPTPIPDPQVTAVFGTPRVDGTIDDCWSNAEVIVPDIYGKESDVTVKYHVMWDDNALYVLAEVLDSTLDATGGAAYQQDSVELFLDERYDKSTTYKEDDVHYRVNYLNSRSTDNGDSTRFYSAVSLMKNDTGATIGYIVESCISWAYVTPENDLEIGFDLQVNEAKNGNRDTTITLFDTTGNAYQNPSLFGKLVLKGKASGSISGVNPYPLLTYIESVEAMNLDIYTNKTIIDVPLANAKAAAGNVDSTQAALDEALTALKAAVDNLDDGSGYTKPSKLPANRIAMPDAFTFENGSKVTTLAEWKARQTEIKGLYEYYVYGKYRSGENVTYESLASHTTSSFDWGSWQTVEKTEYATDTTKFIKINIEKDGRTASFVATLNLPGAEVTKHDGSHPVLIEIGGLGADVKNYLLSEGYATIEFTTGDVASDNANHTGAFYEIYPYGDSYEEQTGVLMAWAWGVSKIMDVLKTTGADALFGIDSDVAIVNGVSRNGKAAAVAGAFDSRIKVTAPSSSGAGGMAAFRYVSEGLTFDYSSLSKEAFIDFQGEEAGTAAWESYQGEGNMVQVRTNQSFTHFGTDSGGGWVVERFREFTDVKQSPVDQNLLAALCAEDGRYLYITTEVVDGDWVNGAATYATYLEAQKVFDALGLGDNVATHIHSVGHAFTKLDAQYLVAFMEKNIYSAAEVGRNLADLKTSVYEDNGNRTVFDTVYNTVKSPDAPVITLFVE